MKTPHQKDLRKGRRSISEHVYSITKRQNEDIHHKLTDNGQFVIRLIESFFFCQEREYIQLGAFVVMPDHYHLLFRLLNKKALSEVIHAINSFTANHARKIFHLKGAFWQKGYYDHAIRSEESLIKHVEYIEANPVRKNFIENPNEWPYSSRLLILSF